MEIEKVKTKVKCDVSGCGKLSDYRIINKRFVFDGNFYLCNECLGDLYGLIGKHVIPKSPKPIFKKKDMRSI